MSLLLRSISSAIMIFAVIVIRAIAINRLPKKTFIALWGIVLLRLLVPFSLPSPFSVYSLVNHHIFATQGAMELGNAIIEPSPLVELPNVGNAVQEQPEISVSRYAVIWGIGLIISTLFFLVSYFKCRREFRESLPVHNDFLTKWSTEHKISRQIEIRQSSCILVPLTYGVFKPIILMPKSTKWDDTKQINYILAHELVHIRHFDAATKLFLTAALCIHWFNPFVWAMYILSNRDIELSCDETVVRSFGETTKSTYALTLISMEETKNTLTPLCNSFSKNAIEERITAIMKMKKASVVTTLVAISIIIGVITAFATSATPVSAMWKTQSISYSPIRISGKDIAAGGKISLGSQLLADGTDCKVLLTFTGDNKLTVLCTTPKGVIKSLPIESGKTATLKIVSGGEYTISVENDNAYAIDNVNGMIEFTQGSGSKSSNVPAGLNEITTQAVTYSNVEMRRYEGTDGHPYIHDSKINETAKKIIGYRCGMLAFDKDGNPLKIDWWSLDTEAESTYFYLSENSTQIAPAETYDTFGGWSLNFFGIDSSVEKIAYVLYCDEEITFEDGTIWTNPNFDGWRSAYEGKKVDVNILKGYYPYEQTINFDR